MARIAEQTEKELPYGEWLQNRTAHLSRDVADTVSYGVVAAAYQLGLAALVVPTRSGRTARLVSAHRPQVPILALSPRPETARRVNLLWGVTPGYNEEPETLEELLADCAEQAQELRLRQLGRPDRRDRRARRPAPRHEPVRGAPGSLGAAAAAATLRELSEFPQSGHIAHGDAPRCGRPSGGRTNEQRRSPMKGPWRMLALLIAVGVVAGASIAVAAPSGSSSSPKSSSVELRADRREFRRLRGPGPRGATCPRWPRSSA